MRFHIAAIIDVDDPSKLLEAARTHCAALESVPLDDPQVAELVPNPAAALAATLTNVMDLAAAADDVDDVEWSALLRAADGPVAISVTDPDGATARYNLGFAATEFTL